MKKVAHLYFLVFYALGTFCLPLGDFSMLNDLPEMYRHCKATEDKDITPFDFISDHLMNIDGMFDKHENGDEQKPHSPIQNHHYGQTTFSFINFFAFSIATFHPVKIKRLIPSVNFLTSDYTTKVFRPPILLNVLAFAFCKRQINFQFNSK